MGSTTEDTTSIIFRGLQLTLPASLPFTHRADGTLVLQCNAFTGEVTLRPGKPNNSPGDENNEARGDEAAGAFPRQNLPLLQARSTDNHNMVIPDSQALSLGGLSWFQRSPSHIQSVSEKSHLEGGSKQLSKDQHIEDSTEAHSLQNKEDPLPTSEQANQGPDSSKSELPASAEGLPNAVLPRAADEESPTSDEQATEKENTPAAANRAVKGGAKRKSGQLSTGKRSGKKQKATPTGPSAAELSFHWTPLECKGTGSDPLPVERWGASFTPIGDSKVCLFAGNSPDEQLGDTWILDVADCTWRRLDVADVPGKAWHSAECVTSKEGKHVYAIGGERVHELDEEDQDLDEGGECLSEICQLDTEEKMWVSLPITGEKLARSGHSTTLLPDGRILLFGGIDNEQRYRNDAHIIDPRRLDAFSLAGQIVRGAPPKPRAYHTATLVGRNIVVLGGTGARPWALKEVYTLSVDTWQWKEHTAAVQGEAPSPRSGHSAVALPGDRHLVVFGGGVPESGNFFSTVAVLDTATWTWTVPPLQGLAKPSGRSGHGMAAITLNGQPVLVMFGGRGNADALSNDTWLLEVQQ